MLPLNMAERRRDATNVQEFPQFICIFFEVFKVVLVEGRRISGDRALAILPMLMDSWIMMDRFPAVV